MATTEPRGGPPLPQVVRDAAEGRLPEWAVAYDRRREHMRRVADLLGAWADAAGLPAAEAVRWRAVGWLHDALRDAEPATLRPMLPEPMRGLAGPILHGPAAAEMLRAELDEPMLLAIRYHTLGHPDLDRLGRALYLADFLEPGRDFVPEWRAELRARMPHDLDEVLVEVVRSRIRHLVDGRRPIRDETAAFWSSLVAGPRP